MWRPSIGTGRIGRARKLFSSESTIWAKATNANVVIAQMPMTVLKVLAFHTGCSSLSCSERFGNQLIL